ncbi:MAG: DUF2232 domain-containing protein [Xanthobacteraceae bacterium]
MTQLIAIGVGAGLASALLFASITSGSPLAVILFYLAALPILIATIGWNALAGLIAAVIATLGLGFAIDWRFALAFALGVGASAWWLGYLAMLARHAHAPDASGQAALEWYPAGRLVLWAAVLGALGVVVVIPYFGFDRQGFESALRGSFERMLHAETAADGTIRIPGINNAPRFLDILVFIMPMAAAVLGTVIYMFNLWLSGHIVKMSGRLRRPWPDLPSIEFPPLAAGLTAITIAGSFLQNIVGLIANVFAVALLTAYGALGLAVLHSVTRGMKARPVVLAVVYALLLFQGWPILIVALLGLIDAAADFRGRIARWRGTPANHS